MSGRGSGGGSGRAHFRSSAGCCICGTKSSSSRFTASQRYAEHFVACFGSSAAQRSGDLCNACVLCVKRWIQRGKRPGLFVQVLDSKRGPGPKHMKEITKRARRREARAAASQLSQLSCSSTTAKLPSLALRQQQQQQQQHHHHHHHQSGTACHAGRWTGLGCAVGVGICVAGDGVCPQSASAGGFRCCLSSSPASQSHTEGATMTRAAAARQLEAANALAAADSLADFYGSPQSLSHTTATSTPNGTVGNGSNTNQGSSRKSVVSGLPTGGKSALAGGFHCSARRCSSSGLVGGAAACCTSTRSSVSSGYYSKGGFDENSCLSDVWSISDDGHHLDFSSEFRPPPPPSTNGNTSNMRTTRAGGLQAAAAAAAAAAGVRSGSPSLNFAGNGAGCGDTSSTASSTPPSTPRRYNRRVQLRPIKMTDSDEVNALLRQIMETNSQAINFDPREMHMAVQRELRLRNRTVNTGGTISSGSTSLSGCCSSSLGYSSEFSSVENGSVEGNPPLTPTTAASAAPSTTQRGRRS